MDANTTVHDTSRDDRIYQYLARHDVAFLRGLPQWVIHALAYGSEAEVIEEGEGPVFLWATPYVYPGLSRYVFAFLPTDPQEKRHHVRLTYVGEDGHPYYADGLEGFSTCFVGFGEAPRLPVSSCSVSVTAFKWREGITLSQLVVDTYSQARIFVDSVL